MPPPSIFPLLGFLLLLAANGFFVAAEFALLTLRHTQVQRLVERGLAGARAVQRLQAQMGTLLSAVQLGVTLCALGLGWAVQPVVLRMLLPLLAHGAWTALQLRWLHGLLAGLAFVLVTLLDIVFAELVPKGLALRHNERLALAIALPMEAFIRLTSPLHGLISGAARAVLRPFGADGSLSWERAHSPDELKMLAGASVHLGHIGQPQADMIEHVLELHELAVREIMTPRHDVLALPINTPLSAALAFLASHPRSRIPVYEGSLDHLVGVLYAKDLVRWAGASRPRAPEPQHLRGLLRRLPILPESKPVDQLLREFQTGHAHMAAVVDEFGTFAGVVTVEDVLEQIVGEVRDEYDLEIEPGRPSTAGPGAMPAGEAVVLDGLTSLRDLEELHGVELPRDESYETLAGFLLFRLGDLPHGGEMVAVPPFRLTILTMAGHRVGQVRVERVAPPPEGQG